MFGEPAHTQADIRFQLLGIPVRIHPMFWLVALFLGPIWQTPIFSVLWVGAMLACILLHELGHAVVMRMFGYRPWIVLHGFGGLAGYQPGEAVARRPGPWGQILICAAGPASGFLLTAAIVAALVLAGHGPQIDFYGPLHLVPALLPITSYWKLFLFYVFQISVLWGLINLLPIFPLDGGQISQQILVMSNPHDALRQSLILSVVTAGSMAALAIIQWKDFYLAIFFGYLAYNSFTMLDFYSGRGRWQ